MSTALPKGVRNVPTFLLFQVYLALMSWLENCMGAMPHNKRFGVTRLSRALNFQGCHRAPQARRYAGNEERKT
jgi:hypothetical protein